MIFNKITAYDMNPMSVPRLYDHRDRFGLNDVLVRKINESTGVVRFIELIDLARNNNCSLLEAANNLSGLYGLDIVYIAHEAKLYNDTYRQAILETYQSIPIQLETVGIDEECYDLLEQAIEEDLSNNDTYYTDYILEGIEQLNDVNVAATNAGRDVGDAVDAGKSVFARIGDTIKKAAGDKIVGAVERALNDPKKVEQVSQAANTFTRNAVKGAVKGATDGIKSELGSTAKKAAVATAALGAFAIFNRQVKNLTNNENINTKDPGRIAKTINSLKRVWSNLSQRRQYASPKQQGLISKLIMKIKYYIYLLGRKLGLANGTRH